MFFVACITALISSLYWARSPTIRQEPQEVDPAFIVRDIPGKGKGMIALRDIRVGVIGTWNQTLKHLLQSAWGALGARKTLDLGAAPK